MERYQPKEMNIFYSLTPQSGVNVVKTLAADYVGALVDPFMPALPDVARRASTMIGNGVDRAQKLRRGWMNPLTFPLAGELNTESAARWAARCLGGTNTPTVVTAATSWDIVTLMQPKSQGRFGKMTSLGFYIGGYDFMFPVGTGKFTASFSADNPVTFAADMVNPGYYTRIGSLTAGAGVLVPSTIPVAPTHHLMHPAATKVTFSDGTTRDYAADGDLISGSCSFDNQMKIRMIPGDPFITASTDPLFRKKGAYARDMHHGDRVPAASLVVAMTSDLRQWTLAQNGTDVTSLTYLFRSEDPISTSPEYYEFEWQFPLNELETVTTGTDGDDAALTLNFYPKTDPTTGSYVIQRVRTDVATLS
jgi:hypothetical protein